MDLTRAEWRKSSYSGGNGGTCVEVARNLPNVVAVVESLHVDGSGGDVASIKAGQHDLS